MILMTKQYKRIKQRIATQYALFRGDLPYGHKVEKDKTKYNRKVKHKENLDVVE